MEKDFEKILEIMKQRKDLELKLLGETKKYFSDVANSNMPSNSDESEVQKELDSFNDQYKSEITYYEDYYSLLSKKIADKIDELSFDNRSSYVELTQKTLLEIYDKKMFDIFYKVLDTIKSKEYYLDFSKYDELAVGLPYSLDFIKLDKVNKVFEDEEFSTHNELSNLDNYIVGRIVEIIDNLPLGSSDTFSKLFKNNIISILDLDMHYLMDQIYESLKYRNYYLDYSQYNNEEFKWYHKNKPYLIFTKIDDPVNNYAVKTEEIEKSKRDFEEKIENNKKEVEEQMARFSTLSKDEQLKEMDKSINKFGKLIDEFKRSDNLFIKDQDDLSNNHSEQKFVLRVEHIPLHSAYGIIGEISTPKPNVNEYDLFVGEKIDLQDFKIEILNIGSNDIVIKVYENKGIISSENKSGLVIDYQKGDSIGKIILNDNIKLFKNIYDAMESWNITLLNK